MIARLVAWLVELVGRRLEADERDVAANVLPRRKGTL